MRALNELKNKKMLNNVRYWFMKYAYQQLNAHLFKEKMSVKYDCTSPLSTGY